MPWPEIRPQWSRCGNNIHVDYEFESRIHDTKFYPVNAPNRSSILVNAHARGVTVLWRGGRPSKSGLDSHDETMNGGMNGKKLQTAGVIDLDSDIEEEPKELIFIEEDEVESTDPFEPIIAQLEIETDIAIHHLAFPSVPRDSATVSRSTVPASFGHTLYAGLACSDGTIRLLTLPLMAPVQSMKVKLDDETISSDKIQLTTIHSQHTEIPRGLTMTYTLLSKNDHETENAPETSRQALSHDVPLLLFASVAADNDGHLVVARLPLHHDNLDLTSQFCSSPLPASPTSVQFNTARFPSRLHNQLLVADSSGAVRICDISRSLNQPLRINWLLPLLPPYSDEHHVTYRGLGSRCSVLDAQWICDGQCVVVLLDSGDWGIWDITGFGRSICQVREQGQVMDSTLSGGGSTRFALRGFVDGISSDEKRSLGERSSGVHNNHDTALAPMTPNTRKSKQVALFKQTSRVSEKSLPPRGAISISPTRSQSNDENLIIWYNNAIYSIPSLHTYWQRANSLPNKAESNTDSLYGSDMIQLLPPLALGEAIMAVTQIPIDRENPNDDTQHFNHDLVICAEHHIAMLCPQRTQNKSSLSTFANPQAFTNGRADLEQKMLQRGELDIGGIDKVLTGMSNHEDHAGTATRQRKVGFSADF